MNIDEALPALRTQVAAATGRTDFEIVIVPPAGAAGRWIAVASGQLQAGGTSSFKSIRGRGSKPSEAVEELLREVRVRGEERSAELRAGLAEVEDAFPFTRAK